MKSKFAKVVAAMTALVFVAAAAFLGTYFGNQASQGSFDSELPVVLKADSAAAGKSLSMATGIVDQDRGVEGLFVLDHLSGNIQCWVTNPRNGNIAGVYTGNANKDLELSKGGDSDFVMVVGEINVIGQRGNVVPAGCICYVGDGNSGKVVGYTFSYDKQLINRNGKQNGPLNVIAKGVARESGMRRDN